MYNFLLTNKKTGDYIQINNLPETERDLRVAPFNWRSMQYSFTRNEKYSGLFPSFSAQLGFTRKAKTWINDIFYTDKLDAELSIKVSAFNSKTASYDNFIDGMGNFETVSLKQFQTDIEIIDNLFIQDILNKDSLELDYQNLTDTYSVNHREDWGLPQFVELKVYNKNEAPETIFAIYPFQLFERIVALMTGKSNSFYSSFFGKAGIDYDENGKLYEQDGEGAYMMVTNGRFIRGYTYGESIAGTGEIHVVKDTKFVTGTNTTFLSELSSNQKIYNSDKELIGYVSEITSNTTFTLTDESPLTYDGTYSFQSQTDSATMIITFQKLFEAFSAMFNLGMTIKPKTNGFYVSIEEKKTFFDPNVIISTIKVPKDLEITFNPDYRINSIKAGYNKFQKNTTNPYGLGEFNNVVTYGTPTKYVKKELNISSDIRADGTGIQLCIDNKKQTSEDSTQTQYDTEIFIISSLIVDGILRSRNDINVNIVKGTIYGEHNRLNCDISPVRMIYKWGDIIRIFLKSDTKVTFQKSEELSRLGTRINPEEKPLYDCADIDVNTLPLPYLSGYEANFTAPFGIDEIIATKNNPFGLIKFWDCINNKYQYGWIKEVSTEPIDKKSNWKLLLISENVTPIERKKRLKFLNGFYMKFLKGTYIAKMKQE